MADETFNFEAEFSLLDIGATSSLLRAGCLRPSVLLYGEATGVDAITLDWDETTGAESAFEDARRHVRDRQPTAYAMVAHSARSNGEMLYRRTDHGPAQTGDLLAIAMFAEDGSARGLLYPIRRTGAAISYGSPTITDEKTTDWCPLGNVWANPFCLGDTVRYKPRERAVDPTSALWRAIVELTRMRIHEDQTNSDEYMSFLDDLRNGIFVVAGRPQNDPLSVMLRPRTVFNPLGTLITPAAALLLDERAPSHSTRAVAP